MAGLLGVLLGSSLSWIKDFIVSSSKKENDGRYAAVCIISVLDEYVQKCVEVVCDDGTSEGRPAGRRENGEEYCAPQVKCPEPPIFPGDINWKSLRPELMYRNLMLPNSAREMDRYICSSRENSFPPDYDEFFAARQHGYATLGLDALSIANEFRKEYKLPASFVNDLQPDWDVQKFLQDKKTEIENRRNARTLSDVTML